MHWRFTGSHTYPTGQQRFTSAPLALQMVETQYTIALSPASCRAISVGWHFKQHAIHRCCKALDMLIAKILSMFLMLTVLCQIPLQLADTCVRAIHTDLRACIGGWVHACCARCTAG